MTQNNPVTFKKSEMHEDDNSWTKFVVAKLMTSSYAIDITKDRAALIYAIVTGKKIDVGKII